MDDGVLREPLREHAVREGLPERQPHATDSYWNIDNDEDTYGWRPDGSATVIEFARATEEVADNVADALLASLRSQGQLFLDDEDASDDLSREARIELALDFVDDNRYGGWEGTWFPMPAGGALLAAEVRLGWSGV